ncbi:Regulator of nonsense transcripts 2 [Venturia nashicola]|uniref:Regulator of nonsense transcripts 2 n=1 Tax=Venturia nashicola TaxID=86259 RepID=A0A4Z1PDA4_9PEZI|nr:Regulator of nonsense transcripts 2 [Venturia nashicola]
MTTIVPRSDSAMAETSISALTNGTPSALTNGASSALTNGASATTEIVPNATSLISSTSGSVNTTTAAEPDAPKEPTDTQGMPPMSIALVAIAVIVIVAMSLLGLGCWMTRRRRLPSVNEMVEVEEEMDELHELVQHILLDLLLAQQTLLVRRLLPLHHDLLNQYPEQQLEPNLQPDRIDPTEEENHRSDPSSNTSSNRCCMSISLSKNVESLTMYNKTVNCGMCQVSLPFDNGTGIWKPTNGTMFSNNTYGPHKPKPSSIDKSGKPPVWLFPNETAYANSSSSNNTATILPSSTGTTTNLEPAIRPNEDPGSNSKAGLNNNDGSNSSAGTSLTATENQTKAAGLTSSSSISTSAIVPAIVIPLTLTVLLVVALIWCCRHRRHKKSKDFEKAYADSSDSMNFTSSARLSRPLQEPAYVAWMDSPRQPPLPLPPPPRAYRPHPRTSSYYPSDHVRPQSPVVSAYEESIRDPTTSPRRDSAVSALNGEHEDAPLPALRDTHGRFMSWNYYHGQAYGCGRRQSGMSTMGNVDAFLSPPRGGFAGADRWVGNGVGLRGYGGNGALEGKPF